MRLLFSHVTRMDVSFCLQSRDTTDMFPINMLNENDQYLSERDKAAPFTVQSQLGSRDERFASLKLRSRRSRNRVRRTRRSFDTRGIGQSDPAIHSDKSETPTDRSEARIHGQRVVRHGHVGHRASAATFLAAAAAATDHRRAVANTAEAPSRDVAMCRCRGLP